MDASTPIRFGGFVLNRPRGCLEDASGALRFLRPKSYRVLEILCERRGQLVSKDDLVAATWPDVIVSDDSLAHCISEVRQALGPEGAGLLRTVPRRGYLLAAEDTPAATPVPAGRRPGALRATVLAAAVALAGVGAWWTLPQDVSAPLPAAAADPMAQANALLDARDWRRRDDNERARRLLEAVIAENAGHAEAWASLGLTYWLEVRHLAWSGGRREMARALAAVEHAVVLGGSARSHRLLAEMRLLAPFPEMRAPIDALAAARAAVAIEPTDADNLVVLANVLALTGHPREAVRAIEQARRLDPAAPDWHRDVAGLCYLLAGEPARAVEELGPLYGAGTFASVRSWPGWLFAASLAHAGRIEEAGALIRSTRDRRPEGTIAAVAQSLDGFADPAGLDMVLDGLRLAGMPG